MDHIAQGRCVLRVRISNNSSTGVKRHSAPLGLGSSKCYSMSPNQAKNWGCADTQSYSRCHSALVSDNGDRPVGDHFQIASEMNKTYYRKLRRESDLVRYWAEIVSLASKFMGNPTETAD